MNGVETLMGNPRLGVGYERKRLDKKARRCQKTEVGYRPGFCRTVILLLRISLGSGRGREGRGSISKASCISVNGAGK